MGGGGQEKNIFHLPNRDWLILLVRKNIHVNIKLQMYYTPLQKYQQKFKIVKYFEGYC